MSFIDKLREQSEYWEANPLSRQLADKAQQFMSDSSKRVPYSFGLILSDLSEKAKEMETAVPEKDKPLKERNLANRVLKFYYENFYFGDDIHTNSLEVYDNFDKNLTTYLSENIKYGFPKPTVLMISDKECMDEKIRAQIVLDKIQKANGFSEIPLYFIENKDDNRYAYANHKGIFINPLLSKYVSDDKLAFTLGHEVAHIICGHVMSDIPVYKDVPTIKSVFHMALYSVNINKKCHNNEDNKLELKALESALERYKEFEADRVGCKMALNAGYKVNEYHHSPYLSEVDLYYHKFNLNDSHPTYFERNVFLKSIDFTKFHFSPQEKMKELKEDYDKVMKTYNIQNYLEVEHKWMKRLIRFVNMDNKLFISGFQQVLQEKDNVRASSLVSPAKTLNSEAVLLQSSPLLRKVYARQMKKKEERLQQIANKIVSSVTLLDKVKFYSQQLVLADKLQLTKVVGNIVGDKISKVEKSVSKVADENRKNRLSIYER